MALPTKVASMMALDSADAGLEWPGAGLWAGLGGSGDRGTAAKMARGNNAVPIRDCKSKHRHTQGWLLDAGWDASMSRSWFIDSTLIEHSVVHNQSRTTNWLVTLIST